MPRTYIRTLNDFALAPALQTRFITETDAFTPDNPTVVHDLASGHSSFFSQPQRLALLLLQAAT